MQFSCCLLVITIIQTGLSIKLTDSDVRDIYKTRMNERTFEIIKNLHLNWYIYSIKALLGQVGKQMYGQLTEDEQKKLALCLDQIEDEHDLVAGAKCLLQARHEVHFRTYRQDFEEGQTPDKIDVTSAFITTSSEEEESLKNYDYKRKNVERYDEMGARETASHPPHSGFENKFLLHPPEASTHFSGFPNILDLNHMKNLIPYTSHTFEHLINSTLISDLPHQQKLWVSRQMYLNQLLLTNNKSDHILMPEENSNEGSETSETSYLIENEIKKTSSLVGQSFNPSHHKKVRRMRSEMQHLKKSRLNKNIDISARHRNFRKNLRKSEWHDSVSINSSEQNKKLYSNSILTKFPKKKLWQRQHRSYRFIADHIMKSEHLTVDVKKTDKMPAIHDSIIEKTLIQRMSRFISVMISGKEGGGNWTKTYEQITELKKQMDQRLESSNARVYNLRLFDLVLGNEKRTRPKVLLKYKDFISMAFDLLNRINRDDKKEELNFRFLSPRIMSLMPDKMQSQNRILSPAILSFYKDDSSDSIVPLPKLLEKSGMMEKDRQAVLEMVMDVSGARIAIEMISDIFKETNIFVLKDTIFEATKRINQAFKTLEKSFSIEQRNEMESKGFTFLEASQLKKMLHQQGIMKSEDIKFDLEKYEQLNGKQREEALWENIKRIVKNETEEEYRKKRQAISLLTPTILSPFMFSPIFGLSILGPVVLSPSIFSPLILNPSILSPYVLSPGIFLPFLLSPYILSPYVLSPLVGAPYILSPYVLSPNVINPYLLSPLVLSPYILSPDIISPQVLGGQILSPYAFSPSIYTDSVLMLISCQS
ncbi:Serum response factor-binding protein [Dirofilaria immitis]